MSHSKFRKKGKSLYIDNWNPAAKRFINTCALCGKQGYSPALDEPDFTITPERKVIHFELTGMFPSALPLDALGRCNECAKVHDTLSHK